MANDFPHLPLPGAEKQAAPTPDLPPVSELPPVADLPPASELPPTAALPPVSELSPVADLPPVSELPPVADLPPVSELPPVADLPPVSELPPVADLPPVSELPPTAALPPVSELPPANSAPQPWGRILYVGGLSAACFTAVAALGFSGNEFLTRQTVQKETGRLTEQQSLFQQKLTAAVQAEAEVAELQARTQARAEEKNAQIKKTTAKSRAVGSITLPQLQRAQAEVQAAEKKVAQLRAELEKKEQRAAALAAAAAAKAAPRAPKSQDEKNIVTIANGMITAITQGNEDILHIIFDSKVKSRTTGKTVSHAAIIEEITDTWFNLSDLECKLLQLGIGKNKIELVFSFRGTNRWGDTMEGYAKQTWGTKKGATRVSDFKEELDYSDQPPTLSNDVESVDPTETE